MPYIRKSLRSTLTKGDAELITKAIILLYGPPRFGTNDRRLQFDSVSVAADLITTLHRAGFDYYDINRELPRE